MTQIRCSLFPSCSGCKITRNVTCPPILEKIEKFFQDLSVPFSFFHQEVEGWRSRVKLAVRGTASSPLIGLFKEGSHEVVKMTSCPLHHPLINEALPILYSKIKEHAITPYTEGKGGRIRYLQMVVGEGGIQLTLVFYAHTLEEKEKVFLKDLTSSFPWHSLWINFLPEETNTIFGRSWELFYGSTEFFQIIGGLPFCFHPSSFSQAHLPLFGRMLETLSFWMPQNASLLELYAGVGCIGLHLGKKASHVILVESSPYSQLCFAKSLERQPHQDKEKYTFEERTVEEFLFPQTVDVIIVDPPRKGLSQQCKEKISHSSATSLFYVSCGPLSFMRDCLELLKSGWILSEAQGFLLFPGTDHLELLARFERRM